MHAHRGLRAGVAAGVLACLCPAALAAGVLIFGEAHDQPDQQRQVADEVQRLAASGELAAVVLEMAETPHTTAALPPDASADAVQQALHWRAWPWAPYADVVMNAVRAGVPVVGGNLPREQMQATLADANLDATVSPALLEQLGHEVRDGHCGLLPDAQLPGMVRVQIARDRTLAQTVAEQARRAAPGQTVLLLTGAQHASRDRGVPLHLVRIAPELPVHVVLFGARSPDLHADERRDALVTPSADHCADLRRELAKRGPQVAPASPTQTGPAQAVPGRTPDPGLQAQPEAKSRAEPEPAAAPATGR